jgi:ABC-type oligopeptide transport system ATPase subunit
VLLSIRDLTKTYRQRQGFLSRSVHVVRALDAVSLDIPRGGTLGVVGESGSGKSTLGRCLLRLTEADAGSIIWNGADGTATDVRALAGDALRRFRPRMQVIFQDPYHSLNPARPVWQVVGEGLFIAGGLAPDQIRERAAAVLESVGLTRAHLDRFPHEFSGGQRQRIAIARALIVEPEFIVCDEVTSALDTRTQAQVLELLRDLQARTGVTLLFISHDLHTVAAMSREVVVMHQGRVVERGDPQRLFAAPAEEYTRTLVAAAPDPDPRRRTFRPAPAA